MLTLGPGEPPAGPWRSLLPSEVVSALLEGREGSSPRVIAVDGRSGSGKSTLAGHLAAAAPGSAIVHVDDVAWNAPMFGWADLLADGVLAPIRRGEAVTYRPPSWDTHQRPGAIEVPAGADPVIVEGVGATRRELTHLLDATVWVQSDFTEAERRGIARDIASAVNGNPEQTIHFWHQWMAAETPFLATDRPWNRASLIVAGTRPSPPTPNKLLVAPPLLATWG